MQLAPCLPLQLIFGLLIFLSPEVPLALFQGWLLQVICDASYSVGSTRAAVSSMHTALRDLD